MTTQTLLIALGAGLLSAVLFALAIAGPIGFRPFAFTLISLPLAFAGVARGPSAAAMAGLAGALALALVLSPAASLMLAALAIVPMVVMTRLVSLRRDGDPMEGAIEWYPIGRVVLATALMAGTFAALIFLAIGDLTVLKTELRPMMEAIVKNNLRTPPADATEIDMAVTALTDTAVEFAPSAMAVGLMGGWLFCLWLGGRIARASNLMERPWPDLAGIHYPVAAPLLLAVSTGAAFLGGQAGLVAKAYSGALFLAYVLLGLAVLHYTTRGKAWRPFVLWAIYFALLLLSPVVSVVVAVLGLADGLTPFRNSPPPQGRGPTST